ncbi:MAG: hypothetical protein KAH67_03430 [Flavobacteriaceae bacterium]|nr:hypothetical protein [Flavobacteriaceae bacterium]
MKYISIYIVIIIAVFSCKEQVDENNAVARVYDQYLYENEISAKIPENLSREDSILFRNNIINSWAKQQLLLQKAKINIEDNNEDINELVKTYKRDLLIDKYTQAVILQELDTLITDTDIDEYYNKNKNIYKLNEDLVQLRYIHFNLDIIDKKEIIDLFRSDLESDLEELTNRELEFNSYNFNDSIWVSYNSVEKKLPILKGDERLKKKKFIQKEDSLGVYLVAVKNVLYSNDVAPKSYVTPTIKNMILHKRKLDMLKRIEQTLVNDAINKKQFEQY